MNKDYIKIFSPFNYLFYGIAFLFTASCGLFALFAGGSSFAAKCFFALYTVGELLLGTAIFALIGSWVKKRFPSWIYKIYIGLGFLLVIAYFLNIILYRLLDVSIVYIYKILFGEGLLHMQTAFQALNLNPFIVIIGSSLLLLLPLAGVGLYALTGRWRREKPWKGSSKTLGKLILCTFLSLLFLDMAAKPFLKAETYFEKKKILPLGRTFLPPSYPLMNLQAFLKEPRNENEVQIALQEKHLTLQKRPNIFLFVTETLRKDFITEEISPHLDRFQKENISFPLSFSNANGTHVSWFSIFHANFPHHWTEVKKNWNKGSVPLQILKKLGYKIHAYHSADLSYFQMDETLFGKKNLLLDQKKDIRLQAKNPADSDKKAVESVFEALDQKEGAEGNLFIVFLDATHSEYSWPDDFPAKFSPFVKRIDYLGMAGWKKDLELVKNRYKNALHFVDDLFGSFVQGLKERNLFDDAVIVFTGDHGEEFFEDGALFHGTHLNDPQTSIPLFYKFGKDTSPPQTTLTSQMDIFPSLLHYLTGEEKFSDLFDGESIFSKERWPFVLTVQQNGGHTPQEFFIHDGTEKLIGKFPEDKDASWKVLSMQDLQGKELPFEEKNTASLQTALQKIASSR